MKTISDIANAEERQIFGKVEVVYSDPFSSDVVTLTASETGRNTSVQAVRDSVETSAYKWFSLHDNRLDGSYHPMPIGDIKYSIGWWGAALSDASGILAVPPTITVEFEARPIYRLQVFGDDKLNNYPVNFTIEAYQGVTLYYTETVVDNTLVMWTKDLSDPLVDITKMVLTITKINQANMVPKILEFYTSIVQTYLNDAIETIHLLEELAPVSNTLPIGSLSANEVDIALDNSTNMFGLNNSQSPLRNYLKRNRRVKVWLGANLWEAVATELTFTRNSVAYLSDGTQVIANTPRYEVGKHSKAIFLEEGTTNLISNADCELDYPKLNDYVNSGCTYVLDNTKKHSGIKSFKVTTEAISTSDRYVQLGAYGSMNGLMAEQIYTCSAWVYVPAGQGINLSSVILRAYDYNGAYASNDSNCPTAYDAWQRLTVSFTLRVDVTASFVRLYIIQDVQNVSVYWDDIQIEQKTYATSFINGTRQADILRLFDSATTKQMCPIDADWTIELWVKKNRADVNTRPYSLLSCTEAGGFAIDKATSTALRFILNDSGIYKYLYSKTTYPLDDLLWHHIAGVYDYTNKKIYLYIDGELQSEATITQLAYHATNNHSLFLGTEDAAGTGSPTNLLNGWIDELRISSKALTAAEILADYNKGVSLPIDESTTCKVNFDDAIEALKYDAEIAWCSLGTFWSTSWNVPDKSLIAYLTARDRLDVLRYTNFTISQVYENYTLYALFELVLLDAGLKAAEFVIDVTLQNIVIPYAWFTRMSHRNALQRLCGCALIHVYCNRDNQIVVGKVTPTSESRLTFDDNVNIIDKDFPYIWSEEANYIEVNVTPFIAQASSTVYTSAESLAIAANSIFEQTYEFNQSPAINIQVPTFTADAGIQMDSYTVYAWGVKIKWKNTTGASANVTSVAITGQTLQCSSKATYVAKDDTSIRENGEIKVPIDHDFIQTTAYAISLANEVLNEYNKSQYDVVINSRGDPSLLLGDRATVNDSSNNTSIDHMLHRQNINWQGSLDITVEARRLN